MRKIVLWALVAIASAAGLRAAWAFRHGGAATSAAAAAEDALAPMPATIRAEGRVVTRPGATVTLSAEIVDTVARVHVVEGQQVKRGDVLLEFHRGEHLAALGEAWAAAREARARLRARSADVKRTNTLAADGALTAHDSDLASEEQSVARARVLASGAKAARAQAELAKTRIESPIDGVVVSRTVEAAETVTPGTPLFVVADLEQLRVDAEVDELDLGRLYVSAPATISAEAFPDASWRGTVEEIPLTVVPRHVRPQDPARPMDSGVVLAKVTLPSGSQLRLGQRVTVRIGTRPTNELSSR